MFKTTTAKSVTEYLKQVPEQYRADVQELHAFIRKTVPALKPFLIAGMIGYGKFHYKSKSGREGDWAIIAIVPQKHYISLYVCAANDKGYVAEQYKKELPQASIGKSCIRFKRLENIDLAVIRRILKQATTEKNNFVM